MMNTLFDLSGKTALVTGGANGIGAAICSIFAEHGARVMVADVDHAGADRHSAQLSQAAKPHGAIRMDVSHPDSVRQAIAQTIDQFGRIDLLVNNAGINTASGRVTIDEYSDEDWHGIISVDLDGVFNVSKAVVPHMKAAAGGRIVNIASVLGMVPARNQSAYVAAKAGVINLTKSMAIELAPSGILVNAIAPGSTLTEATRKFIYGEDAAYSERAQSLLSHIPMGRPGNPEEIAAAALFLAAPASSYVTGIVLPVDGGWTAGYIRDW